MKNDKGAALVRTSQQVVFFNINTPKIYDCSLKNKFSAVLFQ